jgi:hypothetical protein
MDDATIAGGLNQALTEASGSVHFREHFNEVGDRLVIEYHFTELPNKIDLARLAAVFEQLDALYWSNRHPHSVVSIDGAIGGRKVSVEVSLTRESE